MKLRSHITFNNHSIKGYWMVLMMILMTTPVVSHAQGNEEFIYGTITAKSGDTYEGFMRWGKEELTWHDIFNSTKLDEDIRKSSSGKGSIWGDFDWSLGSLWKNNYSGSNHIFACRFGDIATLHLKGRERVEIELKNGAIIKVEGGSNDVGATINMRDYELGMVRFDWDKIKRIDFHQSPQNRRHKYGNLIYGIAETRRGASYQGYIKWDDDERVGEDILHGDSRNGEQEVPFENIAVIEKKDDGSDVTVKSGRTIFLDGSNDVGDGNRGIIVYEDDLGTVKIPWKYFNKLTIVDPPVGPSYSSFMQPQPLEGTVTLYNGDAHSGQLVFDLDEMWDIEILNGEDDYVEYEIPFRNIKSIVPKNRSYSMIYLRNGEELLLGDSQDVSDDNDGVMIINNQSDDAVIIDWDDIDKITFK